ncbi:8639_t:CDS:2 [Scutellospora calospora]|uniref:8639_t:CDS:1 n=1 Tax=Scutellospora calospora TaxID=85575 RepID=A0ACA9L5Z6_9GLOM|nr:8639_t:CDS:2 [Scutellospora calospora]
MSFFGDFTQICETVALAVCPLVGRAEGVEPECYSRNVEIANTLIFQPATFWCLLLNGFVGFQFAEDGTPLSLWFIRITSFLVFLIVFGIGFATFQNIAGFDPLKPVALWIVLYVFNGAALAIYFILQIVLVLNTLDDRWPLGDILFGISFYIIGQVILYLFSVKICDTAKHYIDGLFFGTICTLLGVMMVYKYWDSITKEDLEFSVGSKQNVWEVKELLEDDQGYANYNNNYPPPPPLPQNGFTGYSQQQPQGGYNNAYPPQQPYGY